MPQITILFTDMNSLAKSFKENVLSIVSKIQSGEVLTCKEVAVLCGSPKASRAVGDILNKNYDLSVPCYRVVRSDGKTGRYNRGTYMKVELLIKERHEQVL